MDQNSKNKISDSYSKEEMKKIWVHRIILFCLAFYVFFTSAMKPILALYPLIGCLICVFLSSLISYFMSFAIYEAIKKKGYWIYRFVLAVAVIMLVRNNG